MDVPIAQVQRAQQGPHLCGPSAQSGAVPEGCSGQKPELHRSVNHLLHPLRAAEDWPPG